MSEQFNPFAPDFAPLRDWSMVDYRYGLPDDERLERFARVIDASHKDQNDATSKWRTIDNRVLGLKGERAFARIFGVPMDLKLKKYGNGRENFVLRNGARIDVVTRRLTYQDSWFPDLTIRHKAKSKSKMILYLVVWAGDDREPYHAGWITEQEAHRVGTIRQFKEGIQNTVISIGQLFDPRRLLKEHRPESEWLSVVDEVHHPEPTPIEHKTIDEVITQRGMFQ